MPSTPHAKLLCLPLSLAAVMLLTGCAFQRGDVAKPTTSGGLSGKVIGGQQPVAGAKISIFFPDNTTYGGPGSYMDVTTTDAAGNFTIPSGAYTCPAGGPPIVIVASGGNPGLAASGSGHPAQ